MNKILSILIITLIFSYCSPVRTKYFKPKAKSGSIKIVDIDSVDNNTINNIGRFRDTTLIIMPLVQRTESKSFNDEFNDAVAEFDRGEFKSACEKFAFFAGTLPESDTLYQEAQFNLAECQVVDNKFDEAFGILNLLYEQEELSDAIKQKVILRIGHILCAKGDKDGAAEKFDELKVNYPESIYIKLANCEVVK